MCVEQSEAVLDSKYGINFLLGRNQWSKELDTHNKEVTVDLDSVNQRRQGLIFWLQVIRNVTMNDTLKIFWKNWWE